MAGENKNKKRSVWDIIPDPISTSEVLQRRDPHNDFEVRALERKNVVRESPILGGKPVTRMNRRGPSPADDSRGLSKYLYEPYVRYKRTENPDYKRHRNYSLAGILAGTGMLVTGLASFNYTLAYAGAALAVTSFGYHSGLWWRKERTDRRFEKASSGLESLCEEPKDDALYIRRTHKGMVEISGGRNPRFDRVAYYPLNEPTASSGIGYAGITLTSILAFLALTFYNKGISGAEPMFYATGASALATLGHYIGFIFGKRKAKPEYQREGDLEKKVKTMEDTYGSAIPAQPKYKTLSKYEKELKEQSQDLEKTKKKKDHYPPDYDGPRD
jgi:hypothetical protein